MASPAVVFVRHADAGRGKVILENERHYLRDADLAEQLRAMDGAPCSLDDWTERVMSTDRLSMRNKVAKAEGSLRQKALKLGIGLGHQR